jgi:hypothetical protein
MPRSYLEDNWGHQVSSVQESLKRGLERVELNNLHYGLVKTQQTGKVLAGAVVICELWRLAVAL